VILLSLVLLSPDVVVYLTVGTTATILTSLVSCLRLRVSVVSVPFVTLLYGAVAVVV